MATSEMLEENECIAATSANLFRTALTAIRNRTLDRRHSQLIEESVLNLKRRHSVEMRSKRMNVPLDADDIGHTNTFIPFGVNTPGVIGRDNETIGATIQMTCSRWTLRIGGLRIGSPLQSFMVCAAESNFMFSNAAKYEHVLEPDVFSVHLALSPSKIQEKTRCASPRPDLKNEY